MQEMAEMTPGWAESLLLGRDGDGRFVVVVVAPGPYEVYLGLPAASSVG